VHPPFPLIVTSGRNVLSSLVQLRAAKRKTVIATQKDVASKWLGLLLKKILPP